MLSGRGVVAIWNNIAPEGCDDFYNWHIHEHMPERVGIPGFLRGRRYRRSDASTDPEFFTLYETDTFETLLGQDYANRLNAPTPWTRRATSHFRETSRALARVLASAGQGPGGVMGTARFTVEDASTTAAVEALTTLSQAVSRALMITGCHLCRADDGASERKTAESRDRTDITTPPAWFVLVEACQVEPIANVFASIGMIDGVSDRVTGLYRLEYTSLRQQWTPG